MRGWIIPRKMAINYVTLITTTCTFKFESHLFFAALPSSYTSSSLPGRGKTLKGADREDLLEAPRTDGATRLAAPPVPVTPPIPPPIPVAVLE